MMTSPAHTYGEEVIDLPRIVLKTPPRTGTQAHRQAERPSTSPTIDVMILQAQEHRARCERLLEVLGAPVASCATTLSTKDS